MFNETLFVCCDKIMPKHVRNKHCASTAVYWVASTSPDSSILKILVYDFACLLIVWLLEVTDRFLEVWLATPVCITTPPSANAATCDWTAARCFEFPPFTSSVCGRSEYCESAAEGELRTRTSVGTVSHAPTSAGIFHLFLIQKL